MITGIHVHTTSVPQSRIIVITCIAGIALSAVILTALNTTLFWHSSISMLDASVTALAQSDTDDTQTDHSQKQRPLYMRRILARIYDDKKTYSHGDIPDIIHESIADSVKPLTLDESIYKEKKHPSEKEAIPEKPELRITSDLFRKNIKRFKLGTITKAQASGKMEGEEVPPTILIYGNQRISIRYGKVYDLAKKGDVNKKAHSSLISSGLDLDQGLNISVRGQVGKVSVEVQSTGRSDSKVKITYEDKDPDAFVKKVETGKISIHMPGSRLVRPSVGDENAFGVNAIMGKGPWNYQAILSLTRGIRETKEFIGDKQRIECKKADRDISRRQYFYMQPDLSSDRVKPIISLYIKDTSADASGELVYEQTNLGTTYNYYKPMVSGRDYFWDADKKFLALQYSLNNQQTIIYRLEYTGGSNVQPIDFSRYHEHAPSRYSNTLLLNGREYYYLFESGAQVPCPYEHLGIYRLPSGGVSKKDEIIFRMFYEGNSEIPRATLAKFFYERDKKDYNDTGNNRIGYYITDKEIIFDKIEPLKWITNISGYNAVRTIEGNATVSMKNEAIYGINPKVEDKIFDFKWEYYQEVNVYSLRWNIIENSERIILDGKTLERDKDYVLDYISGRLTLDNSIHITKDSELICSYEYSPFGASLQQIMVGGRVEYKAQRTGWKWLSLNTVAFYSGKQRPSKIPSHPNNASDEKLVGSLGGVANFTKKNILETLNELFSKKYIITNARGLKITNRIEKFTNVPFSFKADGEVALSMYNVNSFGRAMIDDFEGTVLIRSLPLNNKSWYPAPRRGIINPNGLEYSVSDRGVLYYWDFRDPKERYRLARFSKYTTLIGGRAEPIGSYGSTEYRRALYTNATGPFLVQEGHLDASQLRSSYQKALCFNYDLTPTITPSSTNHKFVAVIKQPSYGQSGWSFDDFTELVMWVHLGDTDGGQNTGKVRMQIDLGTFTEDIDEDGVLDYETDKYDDGFIFNEGPGGRRITVVGGGSHLKIDQHDEVITHNNYLDSEDLDNDKSDRNSDDFKQKSSMILSLPNSNWAPLDSGQHELILQDSGTVSDPNNWQQIRININKDAMTDDEKSRLNKIKYIRISLTPVDNAGYQGFLFIDSMYFSGLAWRSLFMNDMDIRVKSSIIKSATNTSTAQWVFTNLQLQDNNFRVFTITKHDNEFYDAHNLRDWQKDNQYRGKDKYDKIHGAVTEDQWEAKNERSIVIKYTNIRTHNFNKKNNAQTNSMYYIARDFRNMDMRFYKQLKLWAFRCNDIAYAGLDRHLTTGNNNEYFFIRLASSKDTAYYEYRIPIQEMPADAWTPIELDMRNEEFLSLNQYKNTYTHPEQRWRQQGAPNLNAINQIAFGIYGPEGTYASSNTYASGEVWINDIYLDKVDIQWGNAYVYGLQFNLDKQFSTSYSKRFEDKRFSPVGEKGSGRETHSRNWTFNWKTVPWFPVTYAYYEKRSQTDNDKMLFSLREEGKNTTKTYKLSGTWHIANMHFAQPITNKEQIKKRNKAKVYIPSLSWHFQYNTNQNSKPSLNPPFRFTPHMQHGAFSTGVNTKIQTPLNLLHIRRKAFTDLVINGSFSYNFSHNWDLQETHAVSNTAIHETVTKWAKDYSFSSSATYKFLRFEASPSHKRSIRKDYKITERWLYDRDTSTLINERVWHTIPTAQGLRSKEKFDDYRLSYRSRSYGLNVTPWKFKGTFAPVSISLNSEYIENGFSYEYKEKEDYWLHPGDEWTESITIDETSSLRSRIRPAQITIDHPLIPIRTISVNFSRFTKYGKSEIPFDNNTDRYYTMILPQLVNGALKVFPTAYMVDGLPIFHDWSKSLYYRPRYNSLEDRKTGNYHESIYDLIKDDDIGRYMDLLYVSTPLLDEPGSSSLSINNSTSVNFGLRSMNAARSKFSMSFGRNAGRNINNFSYKNNSRYTYSYNLDLMKFTRNWKNRFIWKDKKNVTKNSSFQLSVQHSRSKDMLAFKRSASYNMKPTFVYSWNKTGKRPKRLSIGYGLSFKRTGPYYDLNLKSFLSNYKGISSNINMIYNGQGFDSILDNNADNPNHPYYAFLHALGNKKSLQQGFITNSIDTFENSINISYGWSIIVDEYWRPTYPFSKKQIFKRPIKMSPNIDHRSSLRTLIRTYRYHNYREALEQRYTYLMPQVTLEHRITLRLTENIQGDIFGKSAFERKLTHQSNDENLQFDKDTWQQELIIGWQIGIEIRIKF